MVLEHTASELVGEEKSVTHPSGTQSLAELREIGAPEFVQGLVNRRLRLLPSRDVPL